MTIDILPRFATSITKLDTSKTGRDKSRSQIRYLKSISTVTALIESLVETGDFAECLLVLKESQASMFSLLATTEEEKEKVRDMYEALEIGEVHYSVLRDDPLFYRDKIAAGFQKRDRLPPDRIIPKDGMHNALESYSRHVAARHSAFIAEEEKGLINTYISLAAGMQRKYAQLQRGALAKN